jgi:hypothetical protein
MEILLLLAAFVVFEVLLVALILIARRFVLETEADEADLPPWRLPHR